MRTTAFPAPRPAAIFLTGTRRMLVPSVSLGAAFVESFLTPAQPAVGGFGSRLSRRVLGAAAVLASAFAFLGVAVGAACGGRAGVRLPVGAGCAVPSASSRCWLRR